MVFRRNPLTLAALVGAMGCVSLGENDDSFWEPTTGLGGTAGTSAGGGAGTGTAGMGGSSGLGGSAGASTGGAGAEAGTAGTGLGGVGGAGGQGGLGGGAGSAGAGGAGTGGGGAGAGGAGAGGVGGGGMGGGGAGGGGSGGTGGKGECVLTVNVTTQTYGGRYATRNVGAIWVEDASGVFVKTLEVWAERREPHLHSWLDSSNGSRVDAISAATSQGHPARKPTWNCRDENDEVVPDGAYRVRVEFTENASEGEATEMAFTKSLTPETKSFPDTQYFADMSLDFK